MPTDECPKFIYKHEITSRAFTVTVSLEQHFPGGKQGFVSARSLFVDSRQIIQADSDQY